MIRYRLTKSKFILGLQCEKALYLNVYKPQLAFHDQATLERFRKGRGFELKIKNMFPGAYDVSQLLRGNIQGYPDLTATLLAKPGAVTILEAAFIYNDVLVLADVLHRDDNGQVTVYEIKNSLSIKPVFRDDVCIQHYVISKHIAPLHSFQIVYNDGKDNPLYEEMLAEAQRRESLIAEKVSHFKDVIQGTEPDATIDDHCDTPYPCPFRNYCAGQHDTQIEIHF